jgi:hypothetical protein
VDTPWQRAKGITAHEKQERKIGKMQGGQKQVGSGRIWRWKRDGRLFTFLVEARTTTKGSYSISASEFKKIQKEALQSPPGLLPSMQLDIQDVSLMVIRLVDFDELYTRMLDLEAQLAKDTEDSRLP